MTATRQQRFEAIVAEVAHPVLRYALRRTDAQTAEDVLAETLLVVWRRLDDVPPGAELPWCYAVARNQLANAERSARRQRNLVARIVRLDRPAPPVDTPDPIVHEALAQLRPDDQELLRLWAWEDLAPAQIANVLGTSVNAVNIRLHRARTRLGDLLGKQRPSTGHIEAEEGRER